MKMTDDQFNKQGYIRNAGFSLVELAISIIIVGILIAGVIKGKDIIDNARVVTTISQVKTYQSAIASFDTAYGAYPGDLSDLTLLDCLPAVGCAAGNGDRLISGLGSANPAWSDGVAANDEAVQLWKHLAVAEMISDVDVSANVTTVANYRRGVTHPQSRLGGSFDVFFDADFRPNGVDTGLRGHFIRLSLDGLNGVAAANWQYTIKPNQAFVLDRKMDDGSPFTGKVLGAGGNCVTANALGAAYDRTDETEACALFFKFGGRRG